MAGEENQRKKIKTLISPKKGVIITNTHLNPNLVSVNLVILKAQMEEVQLLPLIVQEAEDEKQTGRKKEEKTKEIEVSKGRHRVKQEKLITTLTVTKIRVRGKKPKTFTKNQSQGTMKNIHGAEVHHLMKIQKLRRFQKILEVEITTPILSWIIAILMKE